jgi:predicted transcriptional regulator
LKRRILRQAYDRGEVHSDDVSQEFAEGNRNMIGSAFNSLRGSGLIQSTGEHRRSRMPSAHGRRSYVYRLTALGRSYGKVLNEAPEQVMVDVAEALKEEQEKLFDE